jgi:ATP-dependent protease ClpP protease subunit
MRKNKDIIEQDIFTIHQYNLDVTNREIYLHSYMTESEEPGIDYKCAAIFEKNIRYLNLISGDPILVHMHLPGGEWQDCLGMYDAIKFSKSPIILLAYAKAESSSSVLLQAADLRLLMPNTNVLIHYGFFSLDGEHSKAAASSVQWNEQECDKMIDIFTDRCMESRLAKEKNWKKMMAKKHIVAQLANKCDWILTAPEAVDYGFADGILGTKEFPSIEYIKTYAKKL